VANACALALEAGADLVLMKAENSLVAETFNKIKEFVESGRIDEHSLNQKVCRVLKVKYDYGLFTEFKKENPAEVVRDPGIIALSKHIAKHSVMISKGRDLPLKKTGKILLVEQINKTLNTFQWHPGILYKNCLTYTKNIDYLETSYTFDEEDKERILQNAGKYDVVVITNFYIREKVSNNEFIEGLTAKKLVVITNTPYPLSVPKNCDNLIVTYATSPHNMEVCAGVLFGEITPEGTYPVAWKAS
jgi:beta-N-acetylhexosaminidase